MVRRIAAMLAILTAVAAFVPATAASADIKRCVHHYRRLDKVTGVVSIQCDKWATIDDPERGDDPAVPNRPSSPNPDTKSPQEKYDEKLAEIKKQNSAEMDRYRAEIDRINSMMKNGGCVTEGTNTGIGNACPNVMPPNLTPVPNPPKGAKPPTQPQLPAIDAAYLAIATKLRINAPGVGIGPDPDLSRWKMAVVGHSYWLWATGPTHLGPVSDSASGRTVTLDAHLTAITFQMGDGGVVKCKGAGTPYPGDKTGLYAKSPTCGYTYQTTSKHHAGGTYPVRAIAYWSVAYTAPDGSGTIPIVLASQRNLKVGELQTVITH